MAEKVLDLRSYTTLCGDYTVHIVSALEELPPGGRLRVLAPRESRDLLLEAAENIEAAGIARKIEDGADNDAAYIVLEKT